VAAAEGEDAVLAERIAVAESNVAAANPDLSEAEREDRVAAALAGAGVTITAIATDGAAAFDDAAVQALCATPSVASAKLAMAASAQRFSAARGGAAALRRTASAAFTVEGGAFLNPYAVMAGVSGAFGGALDRADSVHVGHLSSFRSPLTSADVRRSKGKGARGTHAAE
jgi:hypothetical protein